MTDSKPLAGRTVMVTRPAEDAERLVALLEARGARTLAVPTIRIEPGGRGLDGALRDLTAGRFDWMTLTSRATVRVLREAIAPPGLLTKVAVVGEGTARAYTEWTGRVPDLMPRTYETVALGAAFPEGKGRVLCLRADIAPLGLEAAIRSKGWRVVRAEAYRTVLTGRFEPDIRAALRDGPVDAVTFTSASTVRGFVRALRGPPVTTPARGIRVACIGPVTAAEARAGGFRVHAVARPHTTEALADAVERALRRAPTR